MRKILFRTKGKLWKKLEIHNGLGVGSWEYFDLGPLYKEPREKGKEPRFDLRPGVWDLRKRE